MKDDSKKSKQFREKITIIFIGEFLSNNEIFIQTPSTFYDALQHSSSQSFTKEFPVYEYLNFYYKQYKEVRFHYFDGIHRKSGSIVYERGSLYITMDHPINLLFTYFLIHKGNSLMYLTFGPNNKIIKQNRDLFMVHDQSKDYE